MPTPPHEIRIARPDDIAGMATCHAEAFPGRGTSTMGDEWLRFLYRFYLEADMNVSMVAVGSNGEIDGIAVGGDPRLFGRYRKASARRFPLRLAWMTIVDPAVRRPVLNLLRRAVTPKQGGPGATIEADSDMAGLLSIGVRPGAKGSGVAARLIEGFERRCLELGFSSTQLSVLDSNTRARRFYEKAGWTFDRMEGETGVRYRKALRERESSPTR
ncbi:MAG: GNAT family N-acetyltransferase [Phycisphaera sp.]|nr:GNAT family N-acetyltransferase [Actinomycetales bacterium]MCP4833403.1 GNAT family N-acetyltransferase [Phycisphaera sp.]